MKIPQIVINVLLIGAIIYLILKFREYKNEKYLTALDQAQNDNAIILKPINWNTRLERGYKGSEIVALQMMLQYFNPTQVITGEMDDDTYFRVKSMTSGTYDGELTLHAFAYSFFSPRFPGELEKIIAKFPNI